MVDGIPALARDPGIEDPGDLVRPAGVPELYRADGLLPEYADDVDLFRH